MKRLLFIFITFIFALILWISVGVKSVQYDLYLPKSVLDISTPLNVTIDVDFLKSLNPANGQ